MIHTTRAYIEALITGLTKEGKITFIEGKEFSTNIKTKTLTYNMQVLQSVTPLTAKGYLLHEYGHLSYTTETEPTEVEKQHPSMQLVYNTLEDIRVEKRIKDNYGRFAELPFLSLHDASIANALEKDVPPPLHAILQGLLAYNYNIESTTNFNYIKVTDRSDLKTKAIFNEIMNVVSFELVKRFSTTAEVKEYADKKLYPLIKDLLPPVDQQMESEETSKGLPHLPLEASLRGHEQEQFLMDYPDEDLERLFSQYINTLSRKLNDVLKERKATKYTGSHKRGKLMSKNAYKVIVGEKRIFSKKNRPDTPQYVVTMLLDESGSMNGNRHAYTYMGALLLERTCRKLGFPVNVIIYDDSVKIGVVSDYRRLCGGGNREEKALTKAKEIIKKEDDNILFLLTDGGAGVDPRPILKELKKMNTLSIAIGIQCNVIQMKRYYDTAIMVDEVEQLPKTLINLLQKVIHR